ncbi:MAG: hypothetical protein QXD66_01370 [Candidatus Nezhaarchaeales archaeon]|nr:MAG: hypothetical protein DSO06_00995 [Candidatus Nezhaarchaeota archaeon WYZ-LMO8]TDA37365.1 MAG: hypothetical protein DSO05_00180 [Candidatus Nezhaarchaeota archaeon WYZ-LMO7]
MADEIEFVVVGRVTDNVKNLLFENFNNIKSKGFRRVNLRFFTDEAPLRCLEEVRDLLLSNMVVSIKLYEHGLHKLSNVLNQLAKQGKKIVILSDEALTPKIKDLLKDLVDKE